MVLRNCNNANFVKANLREYLERCHLVETPWVVMAVCGMPLLVDKPQPATLPWVTIEWLKSEMFGVHVKQIGDTFTEDFSFKAEFKVFCNVLTYNFFGNYFQKIIREKWN